LQTLSAVPLETNAKGLITQQIRWWSSPLQESNFFNRRGWC